MAFLQIMSGEMKGRKIVLEQPELLIGRSPSCDLPVEDGAVSGKHCVLLRDGRKYSIRDLGSTNGTRLNGDGVQESRLKPGDIVMIGAVELRFDGDDVEVDESVPKTPPRREQTPTVVMSTRFSSNRGGAPTSPATFEAKRNRRGLWIALGIAVAIALIGAGAWFIWALRGSN
jgi:pSer/pThr/pTyr-binding forkhead associated (FHA) protein